MIITNERRLESEKERREFWIMWLYVNWVVVLGVIVGFTLDYRAGPLSALKICWFMIWAAGMIVGKRHCKIITQKTPMICRWMTVAFATLLAFSFVF